MNETVHPLRAYRQKTGVSLASLAKQVGTSKATLSRIETNDQTVSLKLLPKLAAKTGIAPRRLRPDLTEMRKRLERMEAAE